MANTLDESAPPTGDGEGGPAEPVQPANAPLPQMIPKPTFWPAVLALGYILLLLGVVTSWIISAVSLAVVIVAHANWIGELRHEARQQRSS